MIYHLGPAKKHTFDKVLIEQVRAITYVLLVLTHVKALAHAVAVHLADCVSQAFYLP